MELVKNKFRRNNENRLKIKKLNEIIIVYKVNNNKIKLFGKIFIKKNIKNCKIIIENKEQDIKEYLNINKNEKILKIKLKKTNEITDMRNMFYNCSSLVSLPVFLNGILIML